MHRNNLSIEKDCTWGTVEAEPHIVDLDKKQVEEKIEVAEI